MSTDPDRPSPGSLAALAPVLEVDRQSFESVEAFSPAEDRERWLRDSPLLTVAGKAREARRQKAWELSGSPR